MTKGFLKNIDKRNNYLKYQKMKTLQLHKIGRFLSGRSLAEELVAKEITSSDTEITIECKDMRIIAQSFMNELLFRLHEKKISFDKIHFHPANERIQERARREKARLTAILEK